MCYKMSKVNLGLFIIYLYTLGLTCNSSDQISVVINERIK